MATTPLTAAEEGELRAKQLELADALEKAGRADLLYVLPSSLVAYVTHDVPGIDPAVTARVRELNLKVETKKTCVAPSSPSTPTTPPTPPTSSAVTPRFSSRN